MNVSLCYQSYGAGIAVGVSGGDIDQFCNWLYNYGITASNTHYLCDTFAYVLVFDVVRFKRFLITHCLTSLLATMHPDHFLQVECGAVVAPYGLGTVEKDWD